MDSGFACRVMPLRSVTRLPPSPWRRSAPASSRPIWSRRPTLRSSARWARPACSASPSPRSMEGWGPRMSPMGWSRARSSGADRGWRSGCDFGQRARVTGAAAAASLARSTRKIPFRSAVAMRRRACACRPVVAVAPRTGHVCAFGPVGTVARPARRGSSRVRDGSGGSVRGGGVAPRTRGLRWKRLGVGSAIRPNPDGPFRRVRWRFRRRC